MKVTLDWLKDFTPLHQDAKTICEHMTMSGSKAESCYSTGDGISRVVTGHIQSIWRHPQADKLVVCRVDTGAEPLQVVTGADNVFEGAAVPVALDGSELPGGKKIHAGTLRGVTSEGMLCSMSELGLTAADFPETNPDGIMILPAGTPAGMRIQDALGLNDTVIDFEITSNRVDCLSVEGLAREAAVTFDLPFAAAEPQVKALHPDASASQAAIRIEAPDLCYRYCGRVIRNVRVGPSPEWMRRRLRAVGMRPINNIVDITNYCMQELGQPMHAFDLTRLARNEIVVRRAREGEIMTTLDRVQRHLDTQMLVIADAEKAVALAGVMGAENSEITADTTTILLESATFNPISVRQAAQKAGLRTEASSRFEKGLDVHNAIRAMDQACQLVEQLAAGDVCPGTIDVWPMQPEQLQVAFDPDRINRFLGTDIRPDWMKSCLEKLGLTWENKGESSIAKIPSYRPDINSEADLAEEIARFYGYNAIKPSLLSGKQTTLGGLSQNQKYLEKMKDMMVSQGFFEACTYTFESPRQMDRMLLPEDHPLRRAIRIANPLGEEYACMRTSMLPSLLEVAAINWSRSVQEAKVFEISSVYLAEKLPLDNLPEEERHLAAFVYNASERQKPGVAFFQMKGVIDELLLHLGTSAAQYRPHAGCPWLHPGQAAEIWLNGKLIGQAGMVHPNVAAQFMIPTATAWCDILVEPLLEAATPLRVFQPLPRFPAISRDLALVVGQTVTCGQLTEQIRLSGQPYLESISLFDIYQGPQVPAGMKSLAFSLVFRSRERTLVEEDIQPLIAKILESLGSRFSARLRDT